MVYTQYQGVLKEKSSRSQSLIIFVLTLALTLIFFMSAMVSAGFDRSEYTPHHPSQEVSCRLVDEALSKIPQGNGDGVVTDDEIGPGGWRYNGGGRSFVTFAYDLNETEDEYDVVAGRSNVSGNTGIINDYPKFLDLPQDPSSDVLVFERYRGEIVLSGDSANDPPLFALPGKNEGQVRINMRLTGDGTYEGCAKSPFLKNFGFVVSEGGDFVQQEYFKAYAETSEDGTVNFYEWTEVSTFNNTDSDGN